MKKRIGLCAILVMVAVVTIPAMAQNQPRTHDGFFLRFLAGGGPGQIVLEDVQGSDMTFKSTGGGFHFQIGTSIAENFILFGDVGGFSLLDPEVEWEGTSGTLENVSMSAIGFGGGATYYIMPANFFFSGSVMYVSDQFEYENVEGESEYGLGFFLCVGKEWWIGDKWGLGVAAFFETGSPKDKPDAQGNQIQLRNTIFGLMFSATLD